MIPTTSKVTELYLRCYTAHKTRYGQESLEFIIENGKLKYTNNSNYDREGIIRKEVNVRHIVLEQAAKMINESSILDQDDKLWPHPDSGSVQEIEIVLGDKHISFITTKFGSVLEIQKTKDVEGITIFYNLFNDLKVFILSLINMHTKLKPI
eukprot:TRINITY_DN974_c0_g1_i1.p1 TRINITY_DN974_c0_g1~~TRINITY_DN974_c0_g1_i1.p1  ORF type:complete len:152 (-),score=24.75 TRINITY_DN974_c0_g1_i1:25-480(-)